MDYKAAFASAVDQVKAEGRYRVFADLKRHRGAFSDGQLDTSGRAGARCRGLVLERLPWTGAESRNPGGDASRDR